jgi:hypothetical protein
LAAKVAGFIVTADVFEYETIWHLAKLKCLVIFSHQLVVCQVFKAKLEALFLSQFLKIIPIEAHTFFLPTLGKVRELREKFSQIYL